jgi:long-chain acyl-CoA synthetase
MDMLTNLAETLPQAAAKWPGKTALVCGEAAWTYAALDHASARFAGGLRSLGLQKGDRVTLYLANSAEWIIAYHGILKAGGIVNPVNALNTAEEVNFILADCGARFLVTAADRAAAFRTSPSGLRCIIALGQDDPEGTHAFHSVAAALDTVAAAAPEEIAHIGYTSGTTGRPKGAGMTHRGVSHNAVMAAQFHVRSAQDVVLTALPLPHVYGNIVLNATFRTGGTLILHSRFVEADILEAIEAHRVTLLEGVPTMYFYLLAHAGLAAADLSSLTRCTVGGQTMPIAKMQEVEERFGCPLIELWGMTELSGLGTTHLLYGPRRLGSIGITLPFCETRLADLADPKRAAEAGAAGELQVRGPIVMSGYWNNQAATDEILDEDGWLSTGDIATIDADGFIFIVDRKKEMILTGGYNVYPAEIERVLATHPDVAVAAVGRRPDPAKGEIAVAYVVPKPGAKPASDDLIAHCRSQLAAYKVPRAIVFAADLPKTSTGKLLRRELHRLDAQTKEMIA